MENHARYIDLNTFSSFVVLIESELLTKIILFIIKLVMRKQPELIPKA